MYIKQDKFAIKKNHNIYIFELYCIFIVFEQSQVVFR